MVAARKTKKTEKPVTLKATAKQVSAWEKAAADAGMSRQAWCMAMLDSAAGISKLPEHLRNITKRTMAAKAAK